MQTMVFGGKEAATGSTPGSDYLPGAWSTGSARAAVICQGKGAAAGGAGDHREAVSKQGGDERGSCRQAPSPG